MSIKKILSGIREIVNKQNSKPQIAQLKVGGKIIRIFLRNLMNSLLKLGLLRRVTFLSLFSYEELLDIIKSLENKSAGPVSIQIKLLELILIEF